MKVTGRQKMIVAAVTLLFSLSALTALGGIASAATTDAQMGNFSFSYDTATSTLYNVNYTNTNYTVGVADSIHTNGQHSDIASLGQNFVSKTLVLTNVTLFATDDKDMLLLSTTNSSSVAVPSISISLPSAASVVALTSDQKTAVLSCANELMTSFVYNPIYRITVTDGYVYYFSNSPSTLSSDHKTITYLNSSFAAGDSLVVGTTPSGTIKYSFTKQQNSYNLSLDPLSYNKGTGYANGTYLSLNFDPTTGIISNYTNLYTGTTVFSQIYSFGNGVLGGGFLTPMFPGPDPLLLGSVFYYSNNTAVYTVHNNIATLGNFFLNNGTTVFKVDPALTVDTFHPSQNGVGMKHMYGNGYGNFTNFGLGNQYMIQAAPTILMIHNANFTGELFIHDGTVTVNGNTVKVTTTETAHITFVAQVWYMQSQLQVRNQLQYAIQHGMLGAMVSVGPNGPNGGNMTVYYNSSMQLMIQNAETNRVQVQLQSSVQKGANFAMFIPNQLMKNTSQFKLMFDNEQMTQLSSMNSVLNSTNQNQASYYLTQVNGGTLVVVNVPHFTTHSIEITSTPAAGNNNLLTYILITVAVVAVAGIVAYSLVRRGRSGRAS